VSTPDKPVKTPSLLTVEEKQKEMSKFGKPGWGSTVLEAGISELPQKLQDHKPSIGPIYSPPLYIKNGDYASIRVCHLNGT